MVHLPNNKNKFIPETPTKGEFVRCSDYPPRTDILKLVLTYYIQRRSYPLDYSLTQQDAAVTMLVIP